MKYVTLIATLLLSGCFTHIPTPTPPPPGPVVIQVINQSGVVRSARELRIIKTIDNNLRPLGGLFAKLAGC